MTSGVPGFLTQMERVAQSANVRASRRRRYAAAWRGSHYVWGILTVALATLAGAGSLSDLISPTSAAWIALCAALVAALNTFLDSETRRADNLQAAAAWQELA